MACLSSSSSLEVQSRFGDFEMVDAGPVTPQQDQLGKEQSTTQALSIYLLSIAGLQLSARLQQATPSLQRACTSVKLPLPLSFPPFFFLISFVLTSICTLMK